MPGIFSRTRDSSSAGYEFEPRIGCPVSLNTVRKKTNRRTMIIFIGLLSNLNMIIKVNRHIQFLFI